MSVAESIRPPCQPADPALGRPPGVRAQSRGCRPCAGTAVGVDSPTTRRSPEEPPLIPRRTVVRSVNRRPVGELSSRRRTVVPSANRPRPSIRRRRDDPPRKIHGFLGEPSPPRRTVVGSANRRPVGGSSAPRWLVSSGDRPRPSIRRPPDDPPTKLPGFLGEPSSGRGIVRTSVGRPLRGSSSPLESPTWRRSAEETPRIPRGIVLISANRRHPEEPSSPRRTVVRRGTVVTPGDRRSSGDHRRISGGRCPRRTVPSG